MEHLDKLPIIYKEELAMGLLEIFSMKLKERFLVNSWSSLRNLFRLPSEVGPLLLPHFAKVNPKLEPAHERRRSTVSSPLHLKPSYQRRRQSVFFEASNRSAVRAPDSSRSVIERKRERRVK